MCTIIFLLLRKGDVIILKLNIRTVRKTVGLTQEELALRTNLTQAYISTLEQGITRSKSPTLHTMEIIAEALGVCPKELIECSATCKCNI